MYWPSPPEEIVESMEETVVRTRPITSQRCSAPMNLSTFVTEESECTEQSQNLQVINKQERRRFSVGCTSDAIEMTSSYPAFTRALRHEGSSRNRHEAPR